MVFTEESRNAKSRLVYCQLKTKFSFLMSKINFFFPLNP